MPEALKKSVNSDTSFYQQLINFGEKMCKKHKTKKYLNYFKSNCLGSAWLTVQSLYNNDITYNKIRQRQRQPDVLCNTMWFHGPAFFLGKFPAKKTTQIIRTWYSSLDIVKILTGWKDILGKERIDKIHRWVGRWTFYFIMSVNVSE